MIGAIADSQGKSPTQMMLRWRLQEGRSLIPKSTKPHRISENFDVFDFDLTDEDLAAIDELDTDRRGGPEPTDVTLDNFGRPIPEVWACSPYSRTDLGGRAVDGGAENALT